MSWSPALQTFARKYEQRQRDIFRRMVELVYSSIVEGSAVTGAPSMPVLTGTARAGWGIKYLSPTLAQISTGVGYAIHIEDAPSGVTFRNGGPHGVKLTRASFPRLAEQAVREVVGNG